MHTDPTSKEKPTGSDNYPADYTDNVIVPDAAQRIKAGLVGMAVWLALMFRGLA